MRTLRLASAAALVALATTFGAGAANAAPPGEPLTISRADVQPIVLVKFGSFERYIPLVWSWRP